MEMTGPGHDWQLSYWQGKDGDRGETTVSSLFSMKAVLTLDFKSSQLLNKVDFITLAKSKSTKT